MTWLTVNVTVRMLFFTPYAKEVTHDARALNPARPHKPQCVMSSGTGQYLNTMQIYSRYTFIRTFQKLYTLITYVRAHKNAHKTLLKQRIDDLLLYAARYVARFCAGGMRYSAPDELELGRFSRELGLIAAQL